MYKDLTEIGRIKIDDSKDLVVSRAPDKIVVSQYISTQSYRGFTGKTVTISSDNIDSFVKETQRVLSKEFEINILPWGVSRKHELIIKKVPKKEEDFKADKYDFRLYVNNQDYKGYTKKGLRLTRSEVKKLLSFLEKYIDTQELYPGSIC